MALGPTHDLARPEEGTAHHEFPDTSAAVVILGAGLAGLATAVGLHKVGIPAIVLERAPELRQAGNAIGMWPNSFRALDALGLGRKFSEQFTLSTGVQIWREDNVRLRTFSLADTLGEGRASEQRSVGRAILLKAFADLLPKGTIFFSATAASVEETPTGALVTLKSGQQLRAKVVVGAEGVGSPTAKALGLPPAKYEGVMGVRGLVPLKAAEECGALIPNTFVQVWGRGPRFGLIPLDKDTAYWFATGAAPEDSHAYEPEQARAEALKCVQGWTWPAKAIIEAAPLESLQRSRIFDRWMPPGKAFGKGCITCVGDAQHVSTPNLGQGGCAAIEDAVEFTRILRLGVGGEVGSAGAAFKAASPETIEKALREYEVHRTKRTSDIVRKSWITGYVGSVSWAPLCWARNFMVTHLLSAQAMFSHTLYDCGTL